MASLPSKIDSQTPSSQLDESVGNALYDASYSILSIPFTLLINLIVLQIFEPSKTVKENALGLQKISTWNDLGNAALKTALTTASAAPLIFLSQHLTSQLGYSDLSRVKYSISNQLIERTAIMTAGVIASHLLSCVCEITDLLAEG